ncbi:lipopolysaccharide ABC transporter substrate-binding protein LptA [Candidatus Hoaglandella endobia]|uniref:Lipopolysaccharide export system protein LptA n=1 Tax=Candidatus Hoaglandella endobia TaxID=1778263 RepID=A0A143WT63_9ENTR|nr:lipopolysaccharide ABC transporter substrate-binding protein LptA [Candidatus Hoaglandella endobia]CUX97019.1 Lipopolysaccharide export system protein LptA precursor [Candidatus Hoaglandella endobia]
MKFKTIRPSRLLAGSLILILASAPVLALSSDNKQPIHIYSAQQSVNMVTNTVTMTGDVVIKRGSIDIHADKVIITRTNRKEVVEGYGNPVTFYQLQDDGKPVRGYSLKMRYETAKDLVILTGNAYLEQLDNNVKGDYITYLIKQQQMEAFSNKGKRVTTVLVPAQLQDKSFNKR